ncbi:MAG TPA: DUF6065 family protein [Mycobacterium sp.]|nr:DUF6065 family protein [Mycobacterium sp.]
MPPANRSSDEHKSNKPARPLIGFVTRDDAPPIRPAPISRTWMAEMRAGSPTRCLTMLIANQSGWELRNRCAFTATWFGQENGVDVHQKGQVWRSQGGRGKRALQHAGTRRAARVPLASPRPEASLIVRCDVPVPR